MHIPQHETSVSGTLRDTNPNTDLPAPPPPTLPAPGLKPPLWACQPLVGWNAHNRCQHSCTPALQLSCSTPPATLPPTSSFPAPATPALHTAAHRHSTSFHPPAHHHRHTPHICHLRATSFPPPADHHLVGPTDGLAHPGHVGTPEPSNPQTLPPVVGTPRTPL
jgi:hypothetical protein